MTRAERLAARRQRKLETLRKVAIAVAVLAVLWACLALSAARDKALWEGYESRVESGEWEVLVQQNADAILGGEADGLPD